MNFVRRKRLQLLDDGRGQSGRFGMRFHGLQRVDVNANCEQNCARDRQFLQRLAFKPQVDVARFDVVTKPPFMPWSDTG